MIKIHHFEEIPSTQIYLKENLDSLFKEFYEYETHLVSTDCQTNGVGRSGNSWLHLKNAVAFSFNLSPHPVSMTLTTLELGLIVVQFLKQKYQVETFLKWPNDIMNRRGEKCGGIIVNYHNKENLIAGIGINFYLKNEETNEELKKFRIPAGVLFSQPTEKIVAPNFKKRFPPQFYQFFEESRITDKEELINKWNESCFHQNKRVMIDDGIKKKEGVFRGIGSNGEAILEITGIQEEITSGTLSFKF